MVIRKLRMPTCRPNSQGLMAAKLVSSAVMPTSPRAANMPLRRWVAGPGVSVTLTHTAPVEMVSPISKWPHCPSSTAGSRMHTVMRTPSEKF
jgi:hypothetical protein